MQYKVVINNYQKGAKLKTTPTHKIVSQKTLGNNKHEIIYDLDTDREKEFIQKVLCKKLIPIEEKLGTKFKINEKETPNIEVKHKGILEVPEGKNVDDLPLSHFVDLAKKKGLSKITKALNNLQVWNKNDDKKLSKWAGDMIDKLNKKLGKDESIRKTNKRRIQESLSLEDIEFVMNNYIQNKASGIEIINDDNKGNYKIKYNNEIVNLSFNLDDNTASYVYTINAEGPYSTNSYERITMDIKDYVDFNIEENTKLTIRESNESLVKESLYNIIYDYDDEEGNTYTSEEMFNGSWTDLQDLIKKMKYNGCYHIDANAISDEEDFYESLVNENSKKSYWKYYMDDPAIEKIENSINNF